MLPQTVVMLSSFHWWFPTIALWVGIFIPSEPWVRSNKDKSWDWNSSANCQTGQTVPVLCGLGFGQLQTHSALSPLPSIPEFTKCWFWLFLPVFTLLLTRSRFSKVLTSFWKLRSLYSIYFFSCGLKNLYLCIQCWQGLSDKVMIDTFYICNSASVVELGYSQETAPSHNYAIRTKHSFPYFQCYLYAHSRDYFVFPCVCCHSLWHQFFLTWVLFLFLFFFSRQIV